MKLQTLPLPAASGSARCFLEYLDQAGKEIHQVWSCYSEIGSLKFNILFQLESKCPLLVLDTLASDLLEKEITHINDDVYAYGQPVKVTVKWTGPSWLNKYSEFGFDSYPAPRVSTLPVPPAVSASPPSTAIPSSPEKPVEATGFAPPAGTTSPTLPPLSSSSASTASPDATAVPPVYTTISSLKAPPVPPPAPFSTPHSAPSTIFTNAVHRSPKDVADVLYVLAFLIFKETEFADFGPLESADMFEMMKSQVDVHRHASVPDYREMIGAMRSLFDRAWPAAQRRIKKNEILTCHRNIIEKRDPTGYNCSRPLDQETKTEKQNEDATEEATIALAAANKEAAQRDSAERN